LEARLGITDANEAADQSKKKGKEKEEDHHILEEGVLTLKKLLVWTEESRMKMRLMSVLVEGCRGTSLCLCLR
jgi:hypothetical protein